MHIVNQPTLGFKTALIANRCYRIPYTLCQKIVMMRQVPVVGAWHGIIGGFQSVA